MLLTDSQISMRPIFSDLLFKPIECIFLTCLTQSLSWLVGVQSSLYSSNYICIIIPLLYFIFGSFMEFSAMT